MLAVIRWIRDRFSQHIQTRLTGYFLLILLPLVIISLFAVERSRDILYEQAVERTKLALSSAMNQFDLALQNVEEISTLIAGDLGINELLNKNNVNFSPQSIVDFSDILEKLSNYVSVNRFFVSNISIYHQASNMFISTHYGGKKLTSETQQEWLVEAARRNGTGVSYVMSDSPVAEGISFGQMTNTDSISLIRAMDLSNSERQSNLLMVSFNKSRLLNIVKTLLPSENSHITLLNEKGEVVVETGKVYEEHISDKDMTVAIDSDYSAWRLALVQPKSELYKETDQLRLFTVAIIGLSILLAVIISWVVYSGIASPVLKLSRGMKRLSSGELNIHVDTKRKDEFGFLIQSFNKMAVVQKHLIEDHYEQQLRLTTTELKFLQSQINPHFLYNSFFNIYMMCKVGDADSAAELSQKLGNYYQYITRSGSDEVPLFKEYQHALDYCEIQCIRFSNRISFEYEEVSDSLNTVLVPRLMIQPIVENVFEHAFEDGTQRGVVYISAECGQDTIRITVEDNGTLLTDEDIESLQRKLAMGLKHVEKTGLINVNNRLQLKYGPGSGLFVTRSQYGGLKAVLIIKYRSEDENYVQNTDR